jgi:succinoglycan biosynthesis transport protein ExoP
MEFRRYWAMAKRWLWLISLATILAGGAAYCYSHFSTPIYRASATMLVNLATNPNVVAYNDLLAAERLTRTYAELVRSPQIMDEVSKSLSLPVSTVALTDKVSARVIRDTQLLEVSVEYPDPGLARDIANRTAEVFIAEIAEMQQGRANDSRDRLAEQISLVEGEIERMTDAISSITVGDTVLPEAERQAELVRLQSAVSQAQSQYSTLLKNYDEMQLAESRAINTVTIARQAIEPNAPVRPRPLTDMLMGAIMGLMLGAGIAFLLEYLDDTVKTAEDVSNATGLPTLTEVLRVRGARLERGGLISKHSPHCSVSEAYRVLRTNLQFASLDRPLRTLMVTSARAGEGKTTTSGNLGAVLAQAGHKVVIVDGDLRRPALHMLLGLRNTVGLTNLLVAEEANVSEFMQETGVDGLMAITSGPRPPNPSELLGSQRMARVLEQLREVADTIIVDTAPVLLASDAANLSLHVDGTVVVVGAGGTRTDLLARAIDSIQRVKGNVVGVVLNNVAGDNDSYYYGGSKRGRYGYYGYGADQTPTPKGRRVRQPSTVHSQQG